MDENIVESIDEKAIKLRSGKYAIIHNGKMIILEKVRYYGTGYRVIISFSYDDFQSLKDLANKEERLKEIIYTNYPSE